MQSVFYIMMLSDCALYEDNEMFWDSHFLKNISYLNILNTEDLSIMNETHNDCF